MGIHFVTEDAPEKLRLCLYGDSNSGKTTLAATAADVGNTLLISFHAQPQVVAEKKYKFAFVPIKIDHITDITIIVEWLYDGSGSFGSLLKSRKAPTEYEFVVFDGFTVLQRTYMQIILRKDLDDDIPVYTPRPAIVHTEHPNKRHWGILALFTNEVTSTLYGLDKYHVIITCYETKVFDAPETMDAQPRLRGTHPDIQGSAINLLVGRSNVLARITWNGKDSVLRIRQSATVDASYRYGSKIPETTSILTNTSIAQLMGLQE